MNYAIYRLYIEILYNKHSISCQKERGNYLYDFQISIDPARNFVYYVYLNKAYYKGK